MNDLQQHRHNQEQLYRLQVHATTLQSDLLQNRLTGDELAQAKQTLDNLHQQIDQLHEQLLDFELMNAKDMTVIFQKKLSQLQQRHQLTNITLPIDTLAITLEGLPPDVQYQHQKHLLMIQDYAHRIHHEQHQQDLQALHDSYVKAKRTRRLFYIRATKLCITLIVLLVFSWSLIRLLQ